VVRRLDDTHTALAVDKQVGMDDVDGMRTVEEEDVDRLDMLAEDQIVDVVLYVASMAMLMMWQYLCWRCAVVRCLWRWQCRISLLRLAVAVAVVVVAFLAEFVHSVVQVWT